MEVQISLAAWPGLRHEQAAQLAAQGATEQTLCEPLFGAMRVAHVQLVPQNYGRLTDELADGLCAAYPNTRFRLHANVRVLAAHRMADLSGFELHADWFAEAARIGRRLDAPAYSAHSGSRAEASLATLFENARRCAKLMGCPVAIEGQYPTRDDRWLVSSWEEYRELFDSGVPYALDLSHLNILAHATGRKELTLVAEMLACERCAEVHVSSNDGRGDTHEVCQTETWWMPLLRRAHEQAVVFSEGNHRRLGERSAQPGRVDTVNGGRSK